MTTTELANITTDELTTLRDRAWSLYTASHATAQWTAFVAYRDELARREAEAKPATEYVRVNIMDAEPGDEMLQAGKWVEIASVHPMTSSSNVVVRWAGGGSHSFPREHNPAVRRAVRPLSTELSTYCGNYPELDHTGCPSSVECAVVTVGQAEAFARATTERVTFAELAAGDVVLTHGLRVKLAEGRTYESGHDNGLVFSFPGAILNPEYLQTETGRYQFGGIIPLDGSSGWTVQGMGYLTITREVA